MKLSLLTGRTVVVPWDFSEHSQEALSKAVGLVSDNSLIKVIHVSSYLDATEPGVVWGEVTEESVVKHCEEAFQKAVGSNEKYKGIGFTTQFGDPGSHITEYAETEDAELIVISSHGHTGLSRLLIGSVAERVVRLARCPVLVLRKVSPS